MVVEIWWISLCISCGSFDIFVFYIIYRASEQQGEEDDVLYHLYHKQNKLLLVKRVETTDNDMVHGHKIESGEGKFLIKKIYAQSVMKIFTQQVHGSNGNGKMEMENAKLYKLVKRIPIWRATET